MNRGARLRGVLFDLDGTLLDTAPEFASVIAQMLAENGRAPLPFATLRRNVSHGARALVRVAFGIEENEPAFAGLRQRLLDLYSERLGTQTSPFPGVVELLGELGQRGIDWGVVTNKPDWLAAPLLERIGLRPAHRALVCPEHVQRTKPDPEPLLLACRLLGCAIEEAIYVGDHRRDIEAGRHAGMPTISAAWGYLDENEDPRDWGADYHAASVPEISAILEQHFIRAC